MLTGISVLAADGSATTAAVDGLDEKGLLTLAAALEARSEHPLALAMINAGRERGCPPCPVDDVEVSPGLGIARKSALRGT